jgi:lipoprotein-anchoring transpeptidase ErfK/SrfK
MSDSNAELLGFEQVRARTSASQAGVTRSPRRGLNLRRAVGVVGGGKYAIHGTNRPGSIGTFASYECIRIHNRDLLDLCRRVSVGTRVAVVP